MMDTVQYGIVGTGFAGTCTFWHLVQALTQPDCLSSIAPEAISIITVERGSVNGPGYPYAEENVLLSHRCNNQASTMAIHDNDFVDWMVENKPRLLRDHPEFVRETHPAVELASWQPDGDEFYPRALFGLYLRERFEEAVCRARDHGIAVHSYLRHEVVDGFSQGATFSLRLRDLETGQELTVGGFDRVLLGTGHWHPAMSADLAGRDGYLPSPYPPHDVKTALADLRGRGIERPTLFVQGMGPSGIDAILTLCDEGSFACTAEGHIESYRPAEGREPPRIIAGSRCGFFSLVRGALADYDLRILTEQRLDAIKRDRAGRLPVAEVLELLDLELRRATHGAMGWSDVACPPFRSGRDKLAVDLAESTGNLVHTVVLKARRLRFYGDLEPADKGLYDRALDTHFIRTAVPMPPANAEKLLALMDAGILTTIKLGLDGPGPVAAEGGFHVRHRSDDGAPETLRVDAVIRATGQDFAMERHPSPLLRNLLRRGEVVAHQEEEYTTGGIALSPGGYQVMRRVSGVTAPSPHLASFGAPVRYWQNERNFAAAFVEAARWVADSWADHATSAARREPAISNA